jgi:hypothetical protein
MAYSILQNLRKAQARHKGVHVRAMRAMRRAADLLKNAGSRPYSQHEKNNLKEMAGIINDLLSSNERVVKFHTLYGKALKSSGKKSL